MMPWPVGLAPMRRKMSACLSGSSIKSRAASTGGGSAPARLQGEWIACHCKRSRGQPSRRPNVPGHQRLTAAGAATKMGLLMESRTLGPSLAAFVLRPAAGVMVALTVLLGACAAETEGRDFGRPDYATGSAPDLTEAQIIRQLGQPFSRGQVLKHGQHMVSVLIYVRLTGLPGERVRYRKRYSFVFAGSRYLGYSFFSGAPEDQVSYDDRLVAKIIKGKTSKSEVLAMFGNPNEALLYPATPEATGSAGYVAREGDSLVDYDYYVLEADGTWVESKSLRVVFDQDGIAKDVRFAANKKSQNEASPSNVPAL